MRRLTIIFALFISIGFVIPPIAQAGTVKFVSCMVGGTTAPWLTDKLNAGMNKITDYARSTLTKLLKDKLKDKLGSTIGGMSKVPVQDSDVKNATDKAKTDIISNVNSKELWADTIARCGAREILNKISGDIVNTARTSGRDGGTTFVRNWRNFITRAEYRGEDMFRAMLSNTNICNYMAKDAKNSFGVTKTITLPGVNTRSGSLSSYALRANCTMPKDFDIAKYQQDFQGNGGWEAFSRLLDGANNPYGMILMSADEIARQRAIELTADTAQTAANNGYAGISGKDANDSCMIKGMTGTCLVYKDIKTPGSYLAANLAATVQQELAWVANVDEVGELIANLTEITLNRLTNLSNPNEGNAYIEDSLPAEPTPTVPPLPECSIEGAFRYGDEMNMAIITLIGQDPEFLNSVPILGGNPRQPEEIAYPQANLDKTADALLAIIKGNMTDFKGGRIYTSCSGSGNISTDAIIVGKQTDQRGEIYDFKSGAAEEEERPLKDALQASNGGELTDWIRLVP
jgi:hypothetical protein